MELTEFFTHLAGSETSRDLAHALAEALQLRLRRDLHQALAPAS